MNEQVVDRLDEHERRITDLEKNQYEMRNGMLRLENTVLQQGKEQKDLLNKLIDHFFDDRKDARNSKVRLSEIKWTTLVGLFGGGSAIVLVIQWLLSLI
ncbi:MAG TPA: hypothetical protein VEY70_19770 [Metabacillus sp.]|nr:hypothetical protein [Metabacillus sp.]